MLTEHKKKDEKAELEMREVELIKFEKNEERKMCRHQFGSGHDCCSSDSEGEASKVNE